MSKKKKVQIISIFLLILAIILFMPNTKWNESTSVLGFFSLIFGTSGSILSIFIPSNYILLFDKKDWIKLDEDNFVIKIKSNKHGMGKSPQTEVFEMFDGKYEAVGISSEHNVNGEVQVTIPEGLQLSGKIVVS